MPRCRPWARYAKVSTVTPSPDLKFRGQRSKKVKYKTPSNGKTNSTNMLAYVKHAKVSTVTSLSDLLLRDQRSNFKQPLLCKSNFKIANGCVPVISDDSCLVSYTVAVGDCVLYLYDFFLLSTFQSLISQT